MNYEHEKVLKNEAKKQGLTVSSLLNQIVHRYVMFTRFAQKNPTISFTYRTFNPFLENFPKQELLTVGEKLGSSVPKDILLQRGKQKDVETCFWMLEQLFDKYKNWFQYTHTVVNGKDRAHLSHQLDPKWSIFLKGYMKGLFTTICDKNPEIFTSDNSITVQLKKEIKPKSF